MTGLPLTANTTRRPCPPASTFSTLAFAIIPVRMVAWLSMVCIVVSSGAVAGTLGNPISVASLPTASAERNLLPPPRPHQLNPTESLQTDTKTDIKEARDKRRLSAGSRHNRPEAQLRKKISNTSKKTAAAVVPRRLPPLSAAAQDTPVLTPRPPISSLVPEQTPDLPVPPKAARSPSDQDDSVPQARPAPRLRRPKSLPPSPHPKPRPAARPFTVRSPQPVARRLGVSRRLPDVPAPTGKDTRQPETYPPLSAATAGPTLASPSPVPPPPSVPSAWQRLEPQVQATIDRGYELASRGASFSARAEFLRALRMITQVLDTTESSTRHSQALARALRAMQEAEDFAADRAGILEQPDMRQVVTGHRTQLIRPDEAASLTPLAAMQRYFTYARAELTQAVAKVPLAAEPLFALGKMQPLMNDDGEATASLKTARALVYYQVALEADPSHARAANELGVMLARIGRWEEARELLRQAALATGAREIWNNLAAVHDKLGEQRLAELARAEAGRSSAHAQATPATTRPLVQWVDDSAFRTARPGKPSGARRGPRR